MEDEEVLHNTLDVLHSMHERVQRLELSAGGVATLGAPTRVPENEDEEREDIGFDREFEVVKEGIIYFIREKQWGVSIQPGEKEYLLTFRGNKVVSNFYMHVVPDPDGHREEDGQVSKMLIVKRVKGTKGKYEDPNVLIGYLHNSTYKYETRRHPWRDDIGFDRGLDVLDDVIDHFMALEKWGVSTQPGEEEWLFTYRGEKRVSNFYVHINRFSENGQPFRWLKVKMDRKGEGITIRPSELIGHLETITEIYDS